MKRARNPRSPFGLLTWIARNQVAIAAEQALEQPQVEIETDWLGQEIEQNPFVQFQQEIQS
jgi:hypothetical protein